MYDTMSGFWRMLRQEHIVQRYVYYEEQNIMIIGHVTLGSPGDVAATYAMLQNRSCQCSLI